MKMQTLAVDMDDVLTNTAKKLREVYEKKFHRKWTDEELEGKDFRHIVSEKDVSVHLAILNLPGFFRDLEIIDHADQVMKELNKKYEVFIVSAAMEFPNSLKDKFEWLREHLPFITWEQVYLTGSKKIVQTDIMIDDRTRNFRFFEGRPLLFTAHHNLGEKGYERVDNWMEIAEKLL